MSGFASVPIARIRLSYSGTNVTTSAWVQLIASFSGNATKMEIFDSSGQTMELGIGASGSEASIPFYILPGGNAQLITCPISSGLRLSIKAVSGTANTGEIDINFYY